MLERFNLTAPWSLNIDGLVKTPTKVTGIAQFGNTVAGDICFCDREPSIAMNNVADGTVILCTEDLLDHICLRFPTAICYALPDPRATFMDLSQHFQTKEMVEVGSVVPRPFGIHPTARIGEQTVIHPETRIDEYVKIGSQCVIHRGSWIQAGTIIRDNSVIGGDGVNIYLGKDGKRRGFSHFGSVIIGENVEIGSGVVIMSGILTHTHISRESVIGNLSNIGHSAQIKEKVWMSVGCLIGGLTQIGQGVALGLGVAVKDNIVIGDCAQVGMGSVVIKSIPPKTSVFGNPAKITGPIQAGPLR